MDWPSSRESTNARLYNRLLAEAGGIVLPREEEWAKNVYWMYGILLEDSFGVSRDELMDRLREKGVETRAFFIPVHQQPALTKQGLFEGEDYPVAEMLSARGLYLPSGSGLTEQQIELVCQAVKDAGGP